MIIEAGEKLHIVYRALFDKSNRRHFVGEVVAANEAFCRLKGYFFVYDEKKTEFIKKREMRTIVADLGQSGLLATIIDSSVVLDEIRYKYVPETGLVATDGKAFALDINEFGAKN